MPLSLTRFIDLIHFFPSSGCLNNQFFNFRILTTFIFPPSSKVLCLSGYYTMPIMFTKLEKGSNKDNQVLLNVRALFDSLSHIKSIFLFLVSFFYNQPFGVNDDRIELFIISLKRLFETESAARFILRDNWINFRTIPDEKIFEND